MASGSLGQASTTAAKSGSNGGVFGSMALLLARWPSEEPLFPGVFAGCAFPLGGTFQSFEDPQFAAGFSILPQKLLPSPFLGIRASGR
jgi:hypothetical protein